MSGSPASGEGGNAEGLPAGPATTTPGGVGGSAPSSADVGRAQPTVIENAPMRDWSGATFDDFRLVRRLGAGGMGDVYLGEQQSLKRLVAVKLLLRCPGPDPNYVKRFESEARAAATVNHANIVQIYAVGCCHGIHYIAMEYVEGTDLRRYMIRKGPLPVAVTLGVLRHVAAALQRAGEHGIVHRDIKPENILVTRQGEVKVADFGLSRQVSPDDAMHLTKTGVVLGTPQYMSPEQVRGEPLDPRSDIYSLGVTAYHMLAGHPPFKGDTALAVAVQHVSAEPAPLDESRPDLPASVIELVRWMMAKAPESRPASGQEIIDAIHRARSELGSQAASVNLSDLADSRATDLPGAARRVLGLFSRKPLWVASGAVVGGAVALALWLVLSRPATTEPGSRPDGTRATPASGAAQDALAQRPPASGATPAAEPDPRVPPGRWGRLRRVKPAMASVLEPDLIAAWNDPTGREPALRRLAESDPMRGTRAAWLVNVLLGFACIESRDWPAADKAFARTERDVPMGPLRMLSSLGMAVVRSRCARMDVSDAPQSDREESQRRLHVLIRPDDPKEKEQLVRHLPELARECFAAAIHNAEGIQRDRRHVPRWRDELADAENLAAAQTRPLPSRLLDWVAEVKRSRHRGRPSGPQRRGRRGHRPLGRPRPPPR